MMALTKKPKAIKCSYDSTISFIAHTAKIVSRVLKTTEMKIEAVLGENQFGFGRRKGTTAAVGMLRISAE
jgi:hypothetical protein